jgi:hypothetical protein
VDTTVEDGLTEPLVTLLVFEAELVFVDEVVLTDDVVVMDELLVLWKELELELELLFFVEDAEADDETLGVIRAPDDERYQLATGSPRHSPTVTSLNPFARNCWSMNSVKFGVCGWISWAIVSQLFVAGSEPVERLPETSSLES